MGLPGPLFIPSYSTPDGILEAESFQVVLGVNKATGIACGITFLAVNKSWHLTRNQTGKTWRRSCSLERFLALSVAVKEHSQVLTIGEQGECPEKFNIIEGNTDGGGQSLLFTNYYVPAGQEVYEIKTVQLLV